MVYICTTATFSSFAATRVAKLAPDLGRMGCAISEEDKPEEERHHRDTGIAHDVTVSGESGFKRVVKARKLLVIGRCQEDERGTLMEHIVQRCHLPIADYNPSADMEMV